MARLLSEFRGELSAPAAEHGYGDIRGPHLQIFGNIGSGARLTEIATRAQLSLSATSELVNDLETLGYLQRQPDPSDARAKQIVPTARGRDALSDAGDRVADIEQRWAQIVGVDRFKVTCYALQELLDVLDARESRR